MNSYQKSAKLVAGRTHLCLKLKEYKAIIFFLYLEKIKFVNRAIKKIKEENEAEFIRWCNRNMIDKMTEQNFNWKINLVFFRK